MNIQFSSENSIFRSTEIQVFNFYQTNFCILILLPKKKEKNKRQLRSCFKISKAEVFWNLSFSCLMHCVVPDGTSVFSCMPTVTLVSRTDAHLEETEKYRAGRKYTGPTGTATTMEDGESLESLDFVHSWSEAGTQELPSSQKGLFLLLRDIEIWKMNWIVFFILMLSHYIEKYRF